MHAFSSMLEPLTQWLQLHPNLALFIAFFIAFIESLAIVGSIIPGTVVMTAVGILAGSGVMRIDLTLIFGALGAIIGDYVSYLIGYTLSSRIHEVWPFNRYPVWIDYGEKYFERHGSKSVFLGRFIGPLRSIIPVVAGIMKMKQVQFLVTNILSGIAWAIVYISPGILVGAASSELSTEGATRLFLLVLFILIMSWSITVVLRWFYIKVNAFLKNQLNHLWNYLKHNKLLKQFVYFLTPPHETRHEETVTLLILVILLLLSMTGILIWLGFYDELGQLLDLPIYFFFQSLRTQLLDSFFVFILCLLNGFTIIIFFSVLCLYMAYKKNWRLVRYWFSLFISSAFFSLVFSTAMSQIRLYDNPLSQSTFVIPSTVLTIGSALIGFLLLQLGHISLRSLARVLRLIMGSLLALEGLALLFLGDHWLSSILISYGVGGLFALIHWILYRRWLPNDPPSTRALWVSLCVFIASGTFVTVFRYHEVMNDHLPYAEQYVLSSQAWWHQKRPLLPMYTKNRFGHPNGIFNIQFQGELSSLKNSLEEVGWQQRPNSFFKRMLSKANKTKGQFFRTIKTPFYLNKHPELVMTFEDKYDMGKIGFVLCIWRSNYRLKQSTESIWIGSLHPFTEQNKKYLFLNHMKYVIIGNAYSPFRHIMPALNGYEYATVPLPATNMTEPTYPLLMMIKEKPLK